MANRGRHGSKGSSVARTVHPKRSATAFFVLTIVLSIPFWLLGAFLTVPENVLFGLPLTAFQLVAPFVAAVVLVRIREGRSGLRAFLLDAFDLRTIRRRPGTLTLILVMPAVYAAGWALMMLVGQPLPDLQVVWQVIPVLFMVFLVAGLFEEVGWTGYALDPLQSRLGALGAALIIGVVWAGFHLVADMQSGYVVGWIVWHRIGSVMLRVLIVAAVNSTGGGIWAAVVLHAGDNIAWQLFPNGGSHYDPAFVTPFTCLLAVIIMVALGPRTLAPRSARPS